MLFSFSTKGLKQNWLNPTIINVIRNGMAAIDAGRSPEAWPNCLPLPQRAKLNNRSGFRTRLNAFLQAYRGLVLGERTLIRDAIDQQTNLPAVLANDGPCYRLDELPIGMRASIGDLFGYMFDQLMTLKDAGQSIRDHQYSAIYKELGSRLCPYCGLNYFRAPGAPRIALDHFMPFSRYPFVGSDLRNLAPVCDECNSRFKKDCDVLFNDRGQRRRCCYSYSGPIYQIELSSSVMFAGDEVKGFRLPLWEIEFVGGPTEQAQTWDTVYRLRERYIRDVLNPDFLSWIEYFANWYVRQFGPGKDSDEVAATIPRYIECVIQDGLADRAFLKAETFRLINAGCRSPAGGDEVRKWLWSFVEYAV